MVSQQAAEGISALEQEAAVLARLLEALNRRRNYPLERSHYLLLLQLAEGPRKVGVLSRTLALDATTVTRQVAAMEERGLVVREADPDDRRSVLVARTRDGAILAENMRETRLQRMERLMAGWDGEDVDRFADYMARFNAALYDRLENTEDDGTELKAS
ncbi:MarR family transcriptional regulator [Martelella sp. HB161492]|uniref:MarR family winged helix-turn-helix transcriptional regulator n=1 Tax=Martelella sp. HB161492 TaxID=2720726 RepID=UPI001590BD83|nr:MarR family transcriptional regulator [Martelella sp. HB161492]